MEKQELLAKIIENENSAFTDSDSPSLSELPDDFLKRLYLCLIQPAQSVTVKSNTDVPVKNNTVEQTDTVQNAPLTKEDLEISKWKKALLEVQAKLNALRQEEKILLKSLASYGVTAKSIFNASALDLTEADIDVFVQNSQNPIAQIMREAITIRNQQRQTLIDAIVTNSGGLYTVEELMDKGSDELQKLSHLSARRIPEPEMMNPPLNWQGAGIADMSVTNLGVDYGDPLQLPSTWEPLPD
ncbi:MAG: hypothetical protein LBP87_10360 [Planctomycetaceae bacterium]|jgi:hypothetical protein|nr:hypothetical protein [Planctomycetaceae bacterium]